MTYKKKKTLFNYYFICYGFAFDSSVGQRLRGHIFFHFFSFSLIKTNYKKPFNTGVPSCPRCAKGDAYNHIKVTPFINPISS